MGGLFHFPTALVCLIRSNPTIDEASRFASFLFMTSCITTREHVEHRVNHFPSSHDQRCELATCFWLIYENQDMIGKTDADRDREEHYRSDQ